jgi:hypothetical protein
MEVSSYVDALTTVPRCRYDAYFLKYKHNFKLYVLYLTLLYCVELDGTSSLHKHLDYTEVIVHPPVMLGIRKSPYRLTN